MSDVYVPKHLAPPLHDLNASTAADCPACDAAMGGGWTGDHPLPPSYAARWDTGFVDEELVRQIAGLPARRQIGQRRDGSPIFAVPTPKPRPHVTVTGLRITRLNPDGSRTVETGSDYGEDGWPGEGPDEWRDLPDSPVRAVLDGLEAAVPPEEAIAALGSWINYGYSRESLRTRAARDIRELAALGFVWKGTI